MIDHTCIRVFHIAHATDFYLKTLRRSASGSYVRSAPSRAEAADMWYSAGVKQETWNGNVTVTWIALRLVAD